MAKVRESGVTGNDQEERNVETLNKNEKYMEWDDTTSHTHDFDRDVPYPGDKADKQRDFINRTTNAQKLIKEIVENDDEWAFKNVWAPGAFMDGAQYGKFSRMSRKQQDATRIFDKYLDRAENKEGFIVRRLATAELLLGRGNRTPMSLEQLQAMKGQVVTSKGSMSTSMAKHGLTIGSWKPMEYEIRIPGGSKGAGMWIGERVINDWMGRQREFMTNRDSSFMVGDTRYDRSRGVYVTELTWVGHEKHSYD